MENQSNSAVVLKHEKLLTKLEMRDFELQSQKKIVEIQANHLQSQRMYQQSNLLAQKQSDEYNKFLTNDRSRLENRTPDSHEFYIAYPIMGKMMQRAVDFVMSKGKELEGKSSIDNPFEFEEMFANSISDAAVSNKFSVSGRKKRIARTNRKIPTNPNKRNLDASHSPSTSSRSSPWSPRSDKKQKSSNDWLSSVLNLTSLPEKIH